VLVRHGEREETYPVDTKYKLYDERHVAPAEIYQAFLYAFAFHPGHGPRQASLVYPSDRSEVNQRLAVRGSGVTQATIRGVRVNLSELVARTAVGPIVDPDLLMLCAGCGERSTDRPSSAVRARIRQFDPVPDHSFLGDQSALSPAQTAGREGFPWPCQRSSLSSLTCGNAHARMRALPRNRRKREKR